MSPPTGPALVSPRAHSTRAIREVERHALGSDFGATGYTTAAEADQLARLLDLGPGARLLDVGSGHGWPGLYLARETGCDVVLTDRPLEGLQAGARRAARRQISGLVGAVAACATRLPLRPESFDAVVHSDVLCCLRPKLALLRATRRVLRPAGRTAFSAIFPAPGLTGVAARRARAAAPPCGAMRTSYASLLRSARFVDVHEYDTTTQYLFTARRKLEASERFAAELGEVLGDAAFAEIQVRRRRAIAAIEDGLLCRAVFVGRRVSPGRSASWLDAREVG